MARWFPAISGCYLLAIGVAVLLSVVQMLLKIHDYDPNSIFAFLGLTSRNDEYTCTQPPYTARIASYSPLIIHLENFLTPTEAAHLIALGTPLLQPSFVFSPKAPTDTTSRARSRSRSSSTAYLRGAVDPVVECVRRRAAAFQGGHHLHAHMETLQMVRYGAAEQFALHRDWGRRSPAGWERTTTLFAYLRAECAECGTWFPQVTLERLGAGGGVGEGGGRGLVSVGGVWVGEEWDYVSSGGGECGVLKEFGG